MNMESDVMIPIGKRLAEIRRSHHVTQEALADRLGVSPKHISHSERGTSSLSLKNLMEFCRIFGCSLDYIVFGKTKEALLDRLPEPIIRLLCTGSEAEIDSLSRYLSVYAELLKGRE